VDETLAEVGGGGVHTGRRVSLTQPVQEAICAGVRRGLSVGRAGELVGLSEKTVLEWVQRGEGRHPRRTATPALVEFAECVRKAESEKEAEALDVISRAGQGGAVLFERTITRKDGQVEVERRYAPPIWQSAAWFLERTKPERYARQERFDLTELRRELVKRVADEQGLRTSEVLEEAERLLGSPDKWSKPRRWAEADKE